MPRYRLEKLKDEEIKDYHSVVVDFETVSLDEMLYYCGLFIQASGYQLNVDRLCEFLEQPERPEVDEE